MPATLIRVTVPVADIERATTFYGRVLHQPGRRLSAGEHEFSCGGAALVCAESAGTAPHTSPLYLAVPDLENHYGRSSTSGCRAIGRIGPLPSGRRGFEVEDPFGNRLCFVESSPGGDARAETVPRNK